MCVTTDPKTTTHVFKTTSQQRNCATRQLHQGDNFEISGSKQPEELRGLYNPLIFFQTTILTVIHRDDCCELIGSPALPRQIWQPLAAAKKPSRHSLSREGMRDKKHTNKQTLKLKHNGRN